MSKPQQDRSDVYTITSATGSRSADMQQRAGRYLVSMVIRTLCVVLVIVIPGPLRWVFAVGAIVLPYVAVVAANSAGERRQRPLPPPPPGAARSLPAPPPAAAASPYRPGEPYTAPAPPTGASRRAG